MKEDMDRSVWINYFNEFTRRNQWRPTHLQLFGEFGAQDEAHGLPFVAIALNADGVSSSVEIMLGGHDATEPRHLTHVIADVQEITPKRGLDGRVEALEIVSGEGYRNLLRFEPEATMVVTG
jgi:hypothetical protein